MERESTGYMFAFSIDAGSYLTLVMWGTFPLTATDTLIPEVGLLLAPRCQSHLKKLPSPLALGSEGTSKADPKTCDGAARQAARPLVGWVSGQQKEPFRLLLSGEDPRPL